MTYPKSPVCGVTVEAEHDKPSLVWPHCGLVTGMPLGTDPSELWWHAVHAACSRAMVQRGEGLLEVTEIELSQMSSLLPSSP